MAERASTFLGRLVAFGQALEAGAVALVLTFFRLLPLDAASWLGGRLARLVGPLLPVARVAERNLARCFPEMDAATRRRTLAAMWDNLGRVLAEYPHLGEFDVYRPGARVEVVGAEYLDALRDDGKPALFFSAHIGNWEICPISAYRRGLPMPIFYRAPNNPFVDDLLCRARRPITAELIAKGSRGAREALQRLSRGEHVGLLVDQKMNDGIEVPFFGRPAMTAPALAQLALRFDCPVVPAWVVRLEGARFRIMIGPPVEVAKSGDRARDVLTLMTQVNRAVEDWVRAHPEQWLWPHRRWKE
ncbi:MAG TPA: lipid A biosynthesis lauroyl acyltransferase [Alphaproteobacteria bacterium]|nr:lipid A biosynthesis lauroyl acyltransferase [Alphaproteobacteria bacterium]